MKRFLIILSVIVSVFAAILLGSGWYMTGYSLKPTVKASTDSAYVEHMDSIFPGLGHWIDSLRVEKILKDTFIVNPQGRRLRAFYATADNAAGTVILAHGYTDGAIGMMMLGREYRDALNYNIMLPDFQYHGMSEGPAVQMGWKDRLDLEQWMGVAQSLWPSSPIALHGISMGGATVMMCSGDELPSCVKAVVDDCGYTSVWDIFSSELKLRFGLPQHPVMDASSIVCYLRYGWGFKEASALKAVERSTLPMLFIHGDADTFVPTWMVYELFEAKRDGYKKLWVSPACIHARTYEAMPKEYMACVKEFLDETMYE